MTKRYQLYAAIIFRRDNDITTNIPFISTNDAGYNQVAGLYDSSATSPMRNFNEVAAKVLIVSSPGLLYALMKVGTNASMCVSVTNTTAAKGSVVNFQKIIPRSAPRKLNQSTFVIIFSPRKRASIAIEKQPAAVRPVTQEPGPAPFAVCAKNTIPASKPHTNHEKTCGLVFPFKISLKYGI